MTLPLYLIACAAPDDTDTDVSGSGDPPAENVADVVVVGAGPAGLSAAIEAAANGARVLVLEREETYGGSAAYSGARMLFTGSPEQTAAGIVDSPEALLGEWNAITGGDPGEP